MKRTLAVVCLFVCVTLAQAQNAMKAAAASPAASTTAPTKDPVATAARLILQRFQNNTIGAV